MFKTRTTSIQDTFFEYSSYTSWKEHVSFQGWDIKARRCSVQKKKRDNPQANLSWFKRKTGL